MTDITNWPAASLRTVKLAELMDGSPEQRSVLVDASITDGFFYLDFSGIGDPSIKSLVQNLFPMAREYFDEDIQEKKRFDVEKMGLWETFG
jgi:isopenicillin N synthase-like dioxygenase